MAQAQAQVQALTAPPQLPPRTYPRSPLALYTTTAISRPQTAYERYQVLLGFFRRLSFTLTLAGSSAAVIVYIWRKYFLPKWNDTNSARSRVAQEQLQVFHKLIHNHLKPAARRGQGLALLLPSQESQSVKQDKQEEEDEEEVLDLEPSTSAEQEQQQQEPKQIEYHSDNKSEDDQLVSIQKEEEEPRPPRPTPIDLSLLDNVTQYATRAEQTQFANKNALPASTKSASALLTSLSTFNTDIQTQSFLASTSQRSFPSSASNRAPTKSGSTDLAQIKAEIRSLKGALLSRRNFGYGRPTASVILPSS